MADEENFEPLPDATEGDMASLAEDEAVVETPRIIAGEEVTVITEAGEQKGTVSVAWQDDTSTPAIDVIVGGKLLYSVRHADVASSLPAWRAAPEKQDATP